MQSKLRINQMKKEKCNGIYFTSVRLAATPVLSDAVILLKVLL